MTRDGRESAAEPVLADPVEFSVFRLEIARRKLWRGDDPITLPPKAFDMLATLVGAGGRVVEKNEIMRQLWPDTFVSDESITQCVSALRRALGDDSTHPQFIATVPRRGYRLVPALRPAALAAPGDAGDSAMAQPSIPAARAEGPLRRPVLFPLPAATARRMPARRVSPVAVAVAVAVALAIAGIGVAAMFLARTTAVSPTPSLRFVEDAPPGSTLASGGLLAPDGHAIVYVARHSSSRVTSLWIRMLNGTAPRQLPGTSGAQRPFWSPDSRSLGFFSDGRLRRLDLGSGAVQTLATVGPMPVGGSWSQRGVIIFADRRSNLLAVAATGGTPRAATTLNRQAQESAHRHPHFLPDGDHFLYFANSADAARAGTFVASLSGASPRRLLDASSEGTIFADPGHLLHVKEGQLLVQPFDLASGHVAPPAVMATGVDAPQVTNGALLSVSATGLLAYGGGVAASRLIWFDRMGRKIAAVQGRAELHNPMIMGDDVRLLASSGEADRRGTWSVNSSRGTLDWVVRGGVMPVPSPDGSQIAFTSNRGSGISDIYARPTAGTTEALLLRSPEPKAVTDWSSDGRYLVFTSSNPQTKEDIWLLPLGDAGTPRPFLHSPANEMQGAVSPDGHWLAYSSDETGRWEVYVQAFPDGGWRRTVSTAGGVEPHWQRDGRRLFFLAADQHVMAVDIGPGPAPGIGRPASLFQAPLSTDLPTVYRNQFAVAADGQRFVVDALDGAPKPITVVVNWTSLLPANR